MIVFTSTYDESISSRASVGRHRFQSLPYSSEPDPTSFALGPGVHGKECLFTSQTLQMEQLWSLGERLWEIY